MPVEGAAYYKVYRSRQYVALGNGTYKLPSADPVLAIYKDGTLSADGTYYTDAPEYTEKIKGTSVVDRDQGYPYMGYDAEGREVIKVQDVAEAPKEGIRYYYYV